MINASYDKEFVFHDGSRAKNLLELVTKIDYLGDHEFHQFVNHHKNDFANWTEHVLNDKHFADRLRTLISKHETVLAIREKISHSTFGNSIIKIPKTQDPISDPIDSKNVKEEEIEHTEPHNEHHSDHHSVHHNESHKVIHHAESVHNEQVEELKEHAKNKGIEAAQDKHEEKQSGIHDQKKKSNLNDDEKKKHRFLHLFSRKNLSENHVHQHDEFEEVLDDEGQKNRENALWVILYFALVLLIITLLIYRLFL